jgi:hypothetical protein
MIVLLDLNYTLVQNSNVKVEPFSAQIDQEEYRADLAELVMPHRTLLVTARPKRYESKTMSRIKETLGWQPERCYFNDGLPPPEHKEAVLCNLIMPLYGDDAAQYLAVESNPKTAAMYERHGVKSVTYKQLMEQPEILKATEAHG